MFIRQLAESDPIPYDLLLLADPERGSIDQYIYKAMVFVGFMEEELVGCYALDTNDQDKAEIKNIAVDAKYKTRELEKVCFSTQSRQQNHLEKNN